jgi:4-carboxymuconolactone decarboxylase
MLRGALTVGVTPIEAKEVFDFIHVTNEVLTERGVELPLPSQSTTTAQNRMEKGLAIQKQIIGSDAVEKLYAAAPADEQHIQRYLSANCFGDHYTRMGIDIPTRELLTFSMLVSMGGCDPQVKGHVAANLNVGNSRARLIDVLTQLLPFIGYPRTLNGLRAVDDVTKS